MTRNLSYKYQYRTIPINVKSKRIESIPFIQAIVRLLVLLAFFTGFGGIALVYLIMALVVPEQVQITE
jgi:hypothetical protein